MLRKIKKLSVYTLVILLLFSVVPMQSFAALGFDKIDNAVITDYERFSLKDINDYLEYFEDEEMEDDDYQYNLACDLDVAISTGETIKVEDDYGESENKKRIIDVYAYVDARECVKAAEEGKDTVTLYAEVYLFSSIYVQLDKKVITKEIPLVHSYVDSLKLVSGKINAYEIETEFYIDLIVKNFSKLYFDITYGDGRTVRAKAEIKEKTENGITITYYELDGEEIYIYTELDKRGQPYAEIYFMDCYIESTAINVEPYPIKSIKINDVTFDDSFNEKILTFTVTKTDGTKKKVTYDFAENGYKATSISAIYKSYNPVKVDGIEISIVVYNYTDEKYPPTNYKSIVVYADGDIEDTEEFKGPQEEETLLGRILYKIMSIINKIFGIF